jgi:hypothetical protein
LLVVLVLDAISVSLLMGITVGSGLFMSDAIPVDLLVGITVGSSLFMSDAIPVDLLVGVTVGSSLFMSDAISVGNFGIGPAAIDVLLDGGVGEGMIYYTKLSARLENDLDAD